MTDVKVLPNVPRTSIYHIGETVRGIVQEFEKHNPGFRIETLDILRSDGAGDVARVRPRVVLDL